MRTMATLAALCLWLALARAMPSFPNRLPNGRSVPCLPTDGGCTTVGAASYCYGLGHVFCGGGGANSPFGVDFANAGLAWNAALCAADSDGDGLTNGQELGDPCCVWKAGDTPAYSVVSNPSNPASKLANPPTCAPPAASPPPPPPPPPARPTPAHPPKTSPPPPPKPSPPAPPRPSPPAPPPPPPKPSPPAPRASPPPPPKASPPPPKASPPAPRPSPPAPSPPHPPLPKGKGR